MRGDARCRERTCRVPLTAPHRAQSITARAAAAAQRAAAATPLFDLALANPEEIKYRLASVPVYAVVNQKNEFVLVSGDVRARRCTCCCCCCCCGEGGGRGGRGGAGARCIRASGVPHTSAAPPPALPSVRRERPATSWGSFSSTAARLRRWCTR